MLIWSITWNINEMQDKIEDKIQTVQVVEMFLQDTVNLLSIAAMGSILKKMGRKMFYLLFVLWVSTKMKHKWVPSKIPWEWKSASCLNYKITNTKGASKQTKKRIFFYWKKKDQSQSTLI